MKEVLLSINPKWCELIASGKKTIEVRKTAPKLETPFKVYIYCTKDKNNIFFDSHALMVPYKYVDDHSHNLSDRPLNGKVIGEFVCDNIETFRSEFMDFNHLDCYEDIRRLETNDEGEIEEEFITSNEFDDPSFCYLCHNSCVTFDELRKYIGDGFNIFYGWHIKSLIIYNEPKELLQFYRIGKPKKCDMDSCDVCSHRNYIRVNADEFDYDCDCNGYVENRIFVTRPPQSWQYVEGIEV